MPTNHHPRTRAENASFVIDTIRALGIELHPQSRLMRMHHVLTKNKGMIHPDDPDFETAVEAERDMQLLGFVFDQANASDTFGQLVRTVVYDSVLPQDDRRQTRGRDFQFELFVAAVCQSAGLVPVEHAEPDVTCTLDGTTFGVAAKRLKSFSKLERRLRAAAKQIQRTNLPGVIAIDTCVALNPDNRRIITPIPDHEFGIRYKAAFDRFLAAYHLKIRDWVGKGVLGIVFHDHQVRLHTDREWGLASMTMRLATDQDNDEDVRQFDRFASRYVNGLPDLECL
jgi:hypothetical protein